MIRPYQKHVSPHVQMGIESTQVEVACRKIPLYVRILLAFAVVWCLVFSSDKNFGTSGRSRGDSKLQQSLGNGMIRHVTNEKSFSRCTHRSATKIGCQSFCFPTAEVAIEKAIHSLGIIWHLTALSAFTFNTASLTFSFRP